MSAPDRHSLIAAAVQGLASRSGEQALSADQIAVQALDIAEAVEMEQMRRRAQRRQAAHAAVESATAGQDLSDPFASFTGEPKP